MEETRAMIKANRATAKKISSEEEASPRGADADRRAAIMDCADQVFLEAGFQGASMSAIAAKLGGSKGTLYNYFASKEELFLACVSRHCATLQEQMSALSGEDGDVRETLTRIGRHYVEVVSADDLVRKFRMVVAEAERAPDVARAFYEMGPARGAQMLAEYFGRIMRQGLLKQTDALRAAHHFLGLCYNWLSKARLCGYAPAPSAATIKRDVAEAVEIFMTVYAP
jgi:AcrR family transcriptional regulator